MPKAEAKNPARSGNPAKKATAAKKATTKKTASKMSAPSGVSDFSSFKQRAQGQLLPLPSGLVCRARRVMLQTFLNSGQVPNGLMVLVSEALEKGQEADVAEMVGMEDGSVDIEKVNEMFELVNAIVVEAVVEPKVHPLPEPDEERDDDLLYIDEFDDEDKMFLFQWIIGGTDDIASFREEAIASLAALDQK